MSDREDRFEFLRGEENYPPWKIKFGAWGTLKGYMSHISRKKTVQPAPPAGTSPDAVMIAAQEAWDEEDEKVLAALRLKVADPLLDYVSKPGQTAKQAWDTLSDLYEPNGTLGIVLCRRDLYRATCEEGEDVTEHLRWMDMLLNNLMRLKQMISDPDYALIILTSLPPSWNDFINTLTEADLQSSVKVVQRINVRLKLSASNAATASDDTVLAADGEGRPAMSQVKCYECGEMGHFAWQKHGDRRNRRRNEQRGQGSRGGSDCAHVAGGGSDDEYVFSSTNAATPASETWLADSAATSHICIDKSSFATYTAIPSGQ